MKNAMLSIQVGLVLVLVSLALAVPVPHAVVADAVPVGVVPEEAEDTVHDSWLEEPHLSLTYFWNPYEWRSGWYLDNWPEDELAATDTYQFGMREALKLLGVSAKIEREHGGDAWIKLYNVATNHPKGTDYPPHINVMSMWGEAGKDFIGGINGHYYPTANGALNAEQSWYAWHTEPTCPRGERQPGVGVWFAHVDRECRTIYEERVTEDGGIEIRFGAGESTYSLRSNAPTDLDILHDGETVRNVQRVFYDAWINYPEPYPDGMAKVVWEIRDLTEQRLITETIIADPETGDFISHERVESPIGEGPVDEDPVDEDPVDEDPVDEDPVDEGETPPATQQSYFLPSVRR